MLAAVSRLFRHGVVSSTNEIALDAIAAGEARDGDVHVALGQTSGRGRRGRRWWSPSGEGLYASLVLLPTPPAPDPAGLTIAAGLAAFDVVGGLGVEPACLKWPNDLLVAGAKLAGILVEARGWNPREPAFVVGLGFNVHQRSFDARLLAERSVTSLALQGLEVSRDTVLERWIAALADRRRELRQAPAVLALDYVAATGLGGRSVRVRVQRVWHEGLFEGLDLRHGIRLRAGENVRVIPLGHAAAVEAL